MTDRPDEPIEPIEPIEPAAAPSSTGTPYSGAPYAGPPYAAPQYAGPQYTGPQYTGPQYTAPDDPGSAPQPATAVLPAPTAGLRPRRLAALGLLVALVAGLLGGLVGGLLASNRQPDLTQPGVTLGPVPSGSLARPADSVAGIAQRVLPAVVSIEVTATGGGGGTGSGFVIRSDGYLLTNNHVVADAADGGTLTVRFGDGVSLPARIVGRSPTYDLAVVKVTRTGLPVVTLGNSDDVVVGDACIAIGAPLGLAGTVTSGIISAVHRPVTTGGQAAGSEPSYLSALQTDAAINPGNSGGPLVDGQGRVIGVNSAIATLSAGGASGQSGSIGLGFSIPVNQARRVAEQLISDGYATYPVIGAALDTSYQGEGVKLSRVVAGGPSARAGLLAGDVVITVDGTAVAAPEELIVAIRAKHPGDVVELGYSRAGSTHTARITLGEARG